jgi:hypothetical protein
MKFKKLFWKKFHPTLKNILFSPFKFKYLNRKDFLSHIKKKKLSSYEYRIYILVSYFTLALPRVINLFFKKTLAIQAIF